MNVENNEKNLPVGDIELQQLLAVLNVVKVKIKTEVHPSTEKQLFAHRRCPIFLSFGCGDWFRWPTSALLLRRGNIVVDTGDLK